MPSNHRLPGNRLKRLLVGGILICMAIPIGFVSFVAYSIQATNRDYDQVAKCLEQHGFAAQDGWTRTDIALEDFGLIFEVSSGQQWEVQILDGNSVRDCSDRIEQILLSSNSINASNARYLPLSHPALLKALNGQEMRTLNDVLAQLEWLLTWAEAHPETLLTSQEVTEPEKSVSFLSPPL